MTRINVTSVRERIAIGEKLSRDEIDFVLDCVSEATRPTTAYLDPGYELKRIEHLWAYLSADESGEGVCAAPMGGMGGLGVVPLIAADEARLKSLRPVAQHVANAFAKTVRLVKFTVREDQDTIQPEKRE